MDIDVDGSRCGDHVTKVLGFRWRGEERQMDITIIINETNERSTFQLSTLQTIRFQNVEIENELGK